MKFKTYILIFLMLIISASASTVSRTISPSNPQPDSDVTVNLDIVVDGGESYYLITEQHPGWPISSVTGGGDASTPPYITWAVLTGAQNTSYSYNIRTSSTPGVYTFLGTYGFEGGVETNILGKTSITIDDNQIVHTGQYSQGGNVYLNIPITPQLNLTEIPIVNHSISVGGTSYDYAGLNGEYEVYFRDRSSDTFLKPVAINKKDYVFAITPKDFLLYEPHKGGSQGRVGGRVLAWGDISNNEITYENQYTVYNNPADFASLRYKYLGDRVKEELIIPERTYVQSRFDITNDPEQYNITNLVFSSIVRVYYLNDAQNTSLGIKYSTQRTTFKKFGIYIDGELNTNEEVYFTNTNNETIYYIPELYAYDTNGSRLLLNKSLHITTGGNLEIDILTPFMWLNSSEREYPVYIDPTIITLDSEGNITIGVTPEQKDCGYLFCDSEIIFVNNANESMIFNSLDLSVDIEQTDNYDITFDYTYENNSRYFNYSCFNGNCNITGNYTRMKNITRTANRLENLTVEIFPNSNKTFYVSSILPIEEQQFKYNISLYYLGTEYLIDPYFNTTNTTFNNGVYNNTQLNESGYVQLIPQNSTVNLSSGTYTSEVFYSEPYSEWNTLEWVQSVNYGAEYPDNAGTDNGSFYYPLDMSNVVAQYHLNAPSNPLLDTSGNANNMILQVGSGFNQTGKFNGALTFDGIDDYASFTGTAANTITTQDFSFSIWYYIDEAPSTNGVVFHQGGFGEPGWGMRVTDSNQLQVTIEDSVTLYSLYRTFSDDTFFNKWVHLAVTFDRDGCLYAYFDGVMRGGCKDISAVFRSLDGGLDYNVGRYRTGTWFYNGSIDEFAIFKDEILTPEKVRRIYERGSARLNITVRGCDDENCTGDPWNETYTSSPADISQLNVSQYIQYRANYDIDPIMLFGINFPGFKKLHTPELWSVNISHTDQKPVPAVTSIIPNITNSFNNNITVIWVNDTVNRSLTILESYVNLTYSNGTFITQFNYTPFIINGSLLGNQEGIYNLTPYSLSIYSPGTGEQSTFMIDNTYPVFTQVATITPNPATSSVDVYCNITATDMYNITANQTWIKDGVIIQTDYNNAIPNGTTYQFDFLSNTSHTRGDNIICNVTIWDTALNSNNSMATVNYTNNIPPVPVLVYPPDLDSSISSPMLLKWTNVTDPDGDNVSYHVACSNSTPPDYLTTVSTNYTTCAGVDVTTYFWRVRSSDGFSNSSWTAWRQYSMNFNGLLFTPNDRLKLEAIYNCILNGTNCFFNPTSYWNYTGGRYINGEII